MRSLCFVFIFLTWSLHLPGQCPVANFSVPDSSCANSPVSFQNTSSGGTGALTYNWDFCSGDFKNPINGNEIGTYAGIVSASLGNDLVFDGTDYYGFVANNYGALVRLDFGNNFNNAPVMTNLGNVDGIMAGMFDIHILESAGTWYGYYHTAAGALIKLTFGTSLTNTPTSTVLTLTGGTFSTPYYSNLTFDGSNYIYFVANQSSNSISVVNLGNSLSGNSGTVTNISVTAAAPLSVTIGKDCDQWYGFVGYANSSDISRIDFGNSLLNVSPAISTVIPAPAAGTLREMELINEGSHWYLAVNTIDGNNFSVMDFGSSLTNLPVTTSYGTFGVIAAGDYCHTLKKINSEIIGISVNFSTGKVSRIFFPGKSATPVVSNFNSPNTVFSSEGWNYVTLSATDINGNTSYHTDSIFVKPAPLAGFTYTPVCENTNFQLTDTSITGSGTITAWSWDFGDSAGTSALQNPQYTYSGLGNYIISLEVTGDNGCISQATQPIQVASLPVANALFTSQACQNTSVTFTDSSYVNNGLITSWNWEFGNGATSVDSLTQVLFDSAGVQSVSLIVTSQAGCIDSLSTTITILSAPEAGFFVSNTCLDDTVSFTNSTQFSGSGTIDYDWDFGDGQFSVLTDPVNYYGSVAGSWDAMLIATAANGCRDTSIVTVSLSEKAIPEFIISTDTACAGNAITLTDASTAPPATSISEYIWYFGDGDSTTGPVVSHSYQNTGSYIITLTVRTPTSCDTSIQKSIFVIASPQALFSTADVCFGDSVHFTDLSTPPAGSVITDWNYTFGDLDSTTVQHPAHYYATHGIYPVALTVISDRGCTGTYYDTVAVNAIPVAGFTNSKACSNQDIQFTDSSSVAGDVIQNWQWTFGDQNSSQLTNPAHTYSLPGLFTVTLISTSAAGCADTATKFLLVNQSPDHSITGSNTCLNTPSAFTSSIITPVSDTIGYNWDFDDNSFSTQTNPVHTYFASGNYTVSLVTTNLVNTCSSDTTVNITVYALPQAGFTTSGSCINTPVTFTDTSLTALTPIVSWDWDFGNGANATDPSPVIIFDTAGTTNVQLVVSDQNGCQDSITQVFTINALPIVSATPSVTSGVPPLSVTFTNTSSPASYTWDFGDGSALSNAISPTHLFADSGNYVVTLIAASSAGCVDSTDFHIRVTIPFLDLSMESISFSKTNGQWNMQALLRNVGNVDVNEAILYAQLEGKSPIQETVQFSAPIAPGAFQNYIFGTHFLAGENEHPGYFCVEIITVNNETDMNSSNNKLCVSASNDFNLVSVISSPSSNQIYLNVNIPAAGNLAIALYDYTGKLIYQETYANYVQGFNTIAVNATGIVMGVYVARLTYEGKDITEKFLRQ